MGLCRGKGNLMSTKRSSGLSLQVETLRELTPEESKGVNGGSWVATIGIAIGAANLTYQVTKDVAGGGGGGAKHHHHHRNRC
jgi:hypothetical protein